MFGKVYFPRHEHTDFGGYLQFDFVCYPIWHVHPVFDLFHASGSGIHPNWWISGPACFDANHGFAGSGHRYYCFLADHEIPRLAAVGGLWRATLMYGTPVILPAFHH